MGNTLIDLYNAGYIAAHETLHSFLLKAIFYPKKDTDALDNYFSTSSEGHYNNYPNLNMEGGEIGKIFGNNLSYSPNLRPFEMIAPQHFLLLLKLLNL